VAIRDMGGNVAKLNRMFVLVDYHGTGIGQILLDQALDFASEKKFSKIILKLMNLCIEPTGFTKKTILPERTRKEINFSTRKT
jgi:GNAT superfamily N-acetyltransferase